MRLVWVWQVTGLTKDGKPLIIELLLNHVEDPTGKRIFIAVLVDVTALRQLAQMNEVGALVV